MLGIMKSSSSIVIVLSYHSPLGMNIVIFFVQVHCIPTDKLAISSICGQAHIGFTELPKIPRETNISFFFWSLQGESQLIQLECCKSYAKPCCNQQCWLTLGVNRKVYTHHRLRVSEFTTHTLQLFAPFHTLFLFFPLSSLSCYNNTSSLPHFPGD